MINRTFRVIRLGAAIIGAFFLVLSIAMAVISLRQDLPWLFVGVFFLFALSLFFLGPVFKNQVVDIGDQCIFVHSFGKVIPLDIGNLTRVSAGRDGHLSYCFHSDKGWFRISPAAYRDAEELQEEFERLFGTSDSAGETG